MKNLVLGCKKPMLPLFFQQMFLSFLTARWSSTVYVKRWQSLNGAGERKFGSGQATQRSYHKITARSEVKTWKGTEDLKTSRCTCWRGGLAGEWATAEHWKHVSHIRCVVKKNTTETHWGHEYPERGRAADFTHDLCPREFPFNSLCETSGLFAFLDKYGPASCTCSPDNTWQKEHFSQVFDRLQKRNSRWLTQLSVFSNCRWNSQVRRISSC